MGYLVMVIKHSSQYVEGVRCEQRELQGGSARFKQYYRHQREKHELRDAVKNQDRYYWYVIPVKRFYLKPLKHGAVGKWSIQKCHSFEGILMEAFSIHYYLRLHAAQYCTEKTDHAEVFDNIDRFNGQFLQNCRYREQYRTAETKHIADKLVLS